MGECGNIPLLLLDVYFQEPIEDNLLGDRGKRNPGSSLDSVHGGSSPLAGDTAQDGGHPGGGIARSSISCAFSSSLSRAAAAGR